MSDTALEKESTSGLEGGLAALRARMRLDVGEAAIASRVVYVGTAAYAALFTFVTVVHYAVFQTPRDDLGNMVQTVWNTAHGRFLMESGLAGGQGSRLGAHVDPFLALLAPFFWIWSSPLLLLVLQALALASGALPVYWLARKHLNSPRAGAHFAFAYLLYPATQFNAFTPGAGFHSVSLAVPLVLYAVWFLDEDRLVAFSLMALLACTTKEEIPLAVGCLGIWYAVRKGHRLFGLSVFGIGLALTLFNFLWVIPHFSASGVDPYVGRYHDVGGTPGGIAHTLLRNPTAFLRAVASGHKAVYVVLLLVPFLGLALLEPLLLLGAVPDIAINLLSNDANMTTLQFQYTAGILPFLVAASIFGAARFSHRRGIELSLWVMAATAAVAIYSPLYSGARDVRALGSPVVAAKERAVSLIPSAANVAASNQIGAHLSERRLINTFPYVGASRWIVVDLNDPTYTNIRLYKRSVRRYETGKSWRTVYSSHGITVLHKRVAKGS
jgi:uncharacterized membrane protein